MKKIIIFLSLLLPLIVSANSKEINEVKMAIAEQRLKIMKEDGDAANLYSRILREYKKLDEQLAEHSEIKGSKLQDKELTALKLKLLEQDEDLNDSRQRIIKLHRSLEGILHKNLRLKQLNAKLQKLKK